MISQSKVIRVGEWITTLDGIIVITLYFDLSQQKKKIKNLCNSNQLVTLTTHDGVRVRITGITRDFGLLRTVGVEDGDNGRAGAEYTLQPDGNSFDMLKGMISKKT